MAVPFYEFEITRGDDRTYELTVTDAAGAPVNLTGLVGNAIRFTVRKHPHSTAALVTKTVGAGITITDGPAGKFQVALAAADTSGLINFEAVYGFDSQVTVAGKTSTVARGTLTVKPDYSY